MGVLKDPAYGSLGSRMPRGYEFGPFRIEVDLCQLLRDGEVAPLTPKAFDTLLALVRRRDRVVDKDELMKIVWPDSFVSEDSLTQSISVLRRVLGDVSNQLEFIVTVPRRGYRFIAPVIEISQARSIDTDVVHSDMLTPPGVEHPPVPAGLPPRKWIGISMVGSLLAALALVAQPFDAARLRLVGDHVVVASQVSAPQMMNGSVISAARGGILAFGGGGGQSRLVWFSRAGQRLAVVSPDGARIAFTSARIAGIDDIFIQPAGGRGNDELLLSRSRPHADGRGRDAGRYLARRAATRVVSDECARRRHAAEPLRPSRQMANAL